MNDADITDEQREMLADLGIEIPKEIGETRVRKVQNLIDAKLRKKFITRRNAVLQGNKKKAI